MIVPFTLKHRSGELPKGSIVYINTNNISAVYLLNNETNIDFGKGSNIVVISEIEEVLTLLGAKV